MTTLHSQTGGKPGQAVKDRSGAERRQHRRHDMEPQSIAIQRCDDRAEPKLTLGRIVDLSAGGVRVRTEQAGIHPDQQVRVRLELPSYAGICPFVDTTSTDPAPKREWTGWMTVSRVIPVDGRQFDVAGRLVDMEEMDRGMLGLYLSTQPLAA